MVPTVAAVPLHMRSVSELLRPPILAITQKPLSFIQLITSEPPAAASAA